MSKPTPESVREALEHTYHSAWNSETFQREGMNAQRKYQADEILHALWEGVRKASKSHQVDVVQDTNKVLNQAMRCADVLYGEATP